MSLSLRNATRSSSMRRPIFRARHSIFACAFLALASCHKNESPASAAADTSFIQYFTDIAPPDPKSIHELRTTARPGDLVTVSGVIMGREKPFVENRAAFVLGDPEKFTSCDKMAMAEEKHCVTPWDACCATPEQKREGTATVQIVGQDGRALKHGLKGVNGLKELSTVSLTGTIDKSSTAEALVINATAIQVR